ncbi:MAG: RimK family alpha-L-glutamate ligase [Clostridia bacterium]|nr:RimK family alpha-L-glutamate ligase [Clostridia bacterium]
MNGLIIYNGFWNTAEPPFAVRSLVSAAKLEGMTLRAVPNTALTAYLTSEAGVLGAEEPFALFWDKDVRLARAMEACGMRLYNSASAVAVCDDKAATQLALCGHGIPMPETFVAPMTYVSYTEAGEAFLAMAEERLGYPLVVKECFGSLGGQVYLAHSPAELRALAAAMAARPFVLQRFVAASKGMDRRLYVVGSEVVAAMTRQNDKDFRANIGAGGHGIPYTPTAEEAALAVRCCELLGCGVGGVDLLYESGGSPLVCEVNSSAQTRELSACTGIDVDRAIVRYVKTQEEKY